MKTTDRDEILVLDEFRLHAADTDGSVARMVAAGAEAGGADLPLFTSVDDPLDVAVLRTIDAGSSVDDGRARAALGQLVESGQPPRRYHPRLRARSHLTPPTAYRLAVARSGSNDEPTAPPSAALGDATSGEPIAMLVIGVPEGTNTGLLVLVGRDEPQARAAEWAAWPPPLGRELGVRIYETRQVHAA